MIPASKSPPQNQRKPNEIKGIDGIKLLAFTQNTQNITQNTFNQDIIGYRNPNDKPQKYSRKKKPSRKIK